jgi:hypothetical protein
MPSWFASLAYLGCFRDRLYLYDIAALLSSLSAILSVQESFPVSGMS